MHHDGDGIPVNEKEAALLFNNSMEKGNINAMLFNIFLNNSICSTYFKLKIKEHFIKLSFYIKQIFYSFKYIRCSKSSSLSVFKKKKKYI